MSKPLNRLYRFGRFQLDTNQQVLLCNGERVRLKGKEFNILLMLIENRGRTVSATDIVDEVWKGKAVEDNAAQQNISSLREKLDESAGDNKYIKTEHGRGYSFVADVIEEQGEDPNPVQNKSSDQEPEPPVDPPPGKDEEPRAQADEDVTPRQEPSTREGDEENIRAWELTFNRWLIPSGRGTAVALATAVLVGIVISVIGIDDKRLLPALSFLQFLVIASAFLLNPTPRRSENFRRSDPVLEAAIMTDCGYANSSEWGKAKTYADDALGQYTTCWMVLLGSWGLFYFALFLLGSLDIDPISKGAELNDFKTFLGYALTITATLFNNCNALALVMGYIVLNEITILKKGDQSISHLPWAKGIGLLVLFTAVEIILVTFPYFNPDLPNLIKKEAVVVWADWISGIAGGITMALYIGRLQSKFLGCPPWLLLLFYAYVAIQPLYAFINRNLVWAVLLINAALILKCLLYLYTVWLFKSGRLLFYFVRVRRIYEKVGGEWGKFHSLFNEKS